MTEYRLYEINKHGKIDHPAREIDALDDQEAVRKATQLVDGQIIEVWNKDKLVARIMPKDDYKKTK